MKTLIVSYLSAMLRKCALGIAGAGAYIASKGLIDSADSATVDGATTSIATGLAVIATAIISHLLGKWLADPKSSGQVAGNSATAPGWALWLSVGASAGFVVLSLPACSTAQMAAAGAIPIRTTIRTDYGVIGYSSKRGIEMDVDATSGK